MNVSFKGKDIESEQDVIEMVDSFYEKVVKDTLLSPIFNEHAQVDWKQHLPTMYQFWTTLLFGVEMYKGRPFPVHATLPVDSIHFEQWVFLFTQNIDELFFGPRAELAKKKANDIAIMFQYRLGLLDENG